MIEQITCFSRECKKNYVGGKEEKILVQNTPTKLKKYLHGNALRNGFVKFGSTSDFNWGNHLPIHFLERDLIP